MVRPRCNFLYYQARIICTSPDSIARLSLRRTVQNVFPILTAMSTVFPGV